MRAPRDPALEDAVVRTLAGGGMTPSALAGRLTTTVGVVIITLGHLQHARRVYRDGREWHATNDQR
jgi:hypothetical protein